MTNLATEQEFMAVHYSTYDMEDARRDAAGTAQTEPEGNAGHWYD